MQIHALAVALISGLGCGLLALGAMAAPSRSGPGPTPTSPPVIIATPAAAAPTTQSTQEWSFQLDEVALSHDLNAWAAALPYVPTPLGGAHLQDMTVELRDNQFALRGTAEVGWLTAPFDAAASTSIAAGRVLVQLPETHVNGVALPESARRELERRIQNELDQRIGEYHVVVRSVRIADGSLMVSGIRQ
jgi:hypothetical protein